jgi:hypothetical protein
MYWVRFSPFLTLVSAIVLALTTIAAVPTCKLESTALQKLLQRWLGLFAAEQLIPGQLPPQLPVHLPLPEKAEVVGSIVKSSNNFQIILDVVQSPEQVQAFYEQKLLQTGWQKQKHLDLSTQQTGFVNSSSTLDNSSTNQDSTFCSLSHKAKLNIQASYLFVSTTEISPQVHLNLEVSPSKSSSNFQCSLSQSTPQIQLPPLNTPSRVGINANFTAGSEQSAYSYGVLYTELEPQLMNADYAAQIEKFGWQRGDTKHNDMGIWSTWTFKDRFGQPKQGLLSITKFAGVPNQYAAYIEYR